MFGGCHCDLTDGKRIGVLFNLLYDGCFIIQGDEVHVTMEVI